MTARPAKTAPLFWLLFSGGGTASALMLPVLVFITGVAVPDCNRRNGT